MPSYIPLFQRLELETKASCNRACVTCLRESYPKRDRVESWFTEKELPSSTVKMLIHEASALGCEGGVNLSHYNEPLMDSRIEEFGDLCKSLGLPVSICTNADLIDAVRARTLDGSLDWMQVALYMGPEAQREREKELRGWFKKTELRFTGGTHMVTHFSPKDRRPDSEVREGETFFKTTYPMSPCFEPWRRMIIAHTGEMLLCCEDMPGHFNLGTIWHNSLADLWFSPKHQDIVWTLTRRGGRYDVKVEHGVDHCLSCPRDGGDPVGQLLKRHSS